MDKFKECMCKNIGPGGLTCSCCNRLSHKQHGKKDPELHRAARSRMDMDAKKVVEEGVEEYDTRYDEHWDEEKQEWI